MEKAKILKTFIESKTIYPNMLQKTADELKNQGFTLATLNGSFDLLHAGHLQIIYEASKQADKLIVGLNSDASIKSYKSPNRPIIPLMQRLELMASLEFVDYVTWFEELDPKAFITLIKPHVHVNGSEYGINCIEAETVQKFGGRLHLVPLIPGLSTSELIHTIKSLP